MSLNGSLRVSAVALIAALAASDALAQTKLPTIMVGHVHAVTHSHGGKTHTHTLYHTHVIPAPRAADRVVVPVAVADANDGFDSSAQQNTALGPRIDYPAPPKEMPSSSERFFTGGQVNTIPSFRPGEALEVVPGLAVTQHSGEGKANQYYLRGFDLDHGTDLALYLDAMPLNMRTHGHGQGYSDANFVIPEMLAYVDARKGPYNVEDGDFSNAGTIRMQYLRKVPQGVFSTTGGAFGYGRVFGMKSWEFAGGDIFGGGEMSTYDGPWIVPNQARKINGVLRWSTGEENNGASITGMAYANRWNSTDQVPLRAFDLGFSRWGSLNASDGGDTTRFSLSGRWAQETASYRTKVEGFAMHSTLNLFNDFTYFLANPVLGDQFRQFDRRTMIGGNAYHTLKFNLLDDKESELKFGFQSRYDDIRLGLQDSVQRVAYDTVRNDHVGEGSIALLTDLKTRWTPWLKTIVGARWDYYWGSNQGLQNYWDSPLIPAFGQPDFDPTNPFRLWTGPANSGASNAQLLSPKASVILNPFDDKTDFYLNFGRGFHSNDFRATTQRFAANEIGDDLGYVRVPKNGLLSPSTGAEVGVKTRAIDKLESAATLFFIQTAQENIFEGDSGNTVIARGADRIGVELSNHYRPLSWLAFEGDVTATHARFRGYDKEQAELFVDLLQPDAFQWGAWQSNAPGNYLVNATPIIATGVLELGEATGWFANFKYRYIAPRALTQDGFLKSPAIGTVNGRLGYRWKEGWKLQLDVFNMFNSRSMQIAYGYGSMLPTDPLFQACIGAISAPTTDAVCSTGQMGVVGHPIEKPSWRLTFGGPLDFNPATTKGLDLTEPFQLVKFWE
ncbi:TonB-dependent receptor [Methylocystis echinoides]|uniref:TonB-dependent receptor n=1 Tax=Methylocystis echinoides TaxID=29468 RepID=A0A9W6GWR1_9HYPH|nr:TonB-dependent receptor [Methylocystis echinoides]GLI94285.1 TonB-dependent receptor [Methylocystis echinoides]